MPPKKKSPSRSFKKIDLEKKPAVKRVVKKRVSVSARKKAVKPVLRSSKSGGGKTGYKKAKINQELKDIYKNDDGSMPNMRNFGRKKKRSLFRAFLALIMACAFLGAVAWVGFFIFQPQLQFAESDVVLNITGDEKVTAGEELTYRVRYRNSQNTPLSKVVLQVRYPEGFVFVDASQVPGNDQKNEWELGTLSEHDSGYIDITGRIFGDIEKKQSFRAFLNYYPSNFSSEFQKVFTLTTEVEESPVAMNIKSPEEVVPGAETEFVVELAIEDGLDLNNLGLLMEPAGGFTKTGDQPVSVEGDDYLWSLADLGEDNKISIRGSFNPETGAEEAKLRFKIVGWKDADRQVEPYIFGEREVDLAMLQSDMSVSLAINGSLNDIDVEPGEALNTSISLKNPGDIELKNVVVRLVYETPSFNDLSMLDWYELNDPADGDIRGEQINPQSRRGYITWNKYHVKDLTQIDPGEEINIDLSIPYKDSDDIDLTKFGGHMATALVEVKYENGDEEKLLTSNEIEMMINSDLNFEVRDKVIENSNNKQEHNITWFLENHYHELKDIELSADFYGNISWVEESLKSGGGEYTWDSKTQKLTWSIETMPTSVDVLALQFGFVLNSKNPSQTNLASKVTLKATDTITGEQIIKVGDEILLQ